MVSAGHAGKAGGLRRGGVEEGGEGFGCWRVLWWCNRAG